MIIYSLNPLSLVKATVRKPYFELFVSVRAPCSESSKQLLSSRPRLSGERSTSCIWGSEAEKHFLDKTLPFVTL